MNRPSAVGKAARRRSSLFRSSGIPKSPRAAVRRTVTATPSRLQKPLPDTITTGRCSTPNLSRTSSTFSGKASTRSALGAPLPPSATTGRATVFGSRAVERTRLTTRTAPAPVSSRATGSATTRGQRTTAVPVANSTRSSIPSRPPSELAVLEARLAEVEQHNLELKRENSSLQDHVQCLRDHGELIKRLHETSKMKLEQTANELASIKEVLALTKEQLEEKKLLIGEMTKQLDEKETVLRKMHNDVVDLRGQIRVAIRVRPPLESEKDAFNPIEYPAVNAIAVNQGGKTGPQFKFEKVFTPIFSQEEVFVNIEDFIQSALHGYNVGLIAFGQTGSGKTHTMRGGSGEQQGVIPRAAEFLFNESRKLERIGWLFEFSLSALEIYNNEAYDLLNKRGSIKVRLSAGSVALDGMTEHKLARLNDISDLLRRADASRVTAATKCNEHSSRSHAVYMWTIKANQESTGITTTSVLKLVDLAGSERAKESGATGQQFTEMTAINTSLSALQKCVSLQKTKSKHVPYRDSKLTQVLMDCLGAGNSKTMVIVNINPVSENESKRSIDFAARMRDTHIGSAVQQRDL